MLLFTMHLVTTIISNEIVNLIFIFPSVSDLECVTMFIKMTLLRSIDLVKPKLVIF